MLAINEMQKGERPDSGSFKSDLEEEKQTKTEAATDILLKKSIITTSNLLPVNIEEITPTLLAWSSWRDNMISVIDLETKEDYGNFYGARIRYPQVGVWDLNIQTNMTHVKEIPNTKLIVSLHHNCNKSANLAIFDISKKRQPKIIYTLGEVYGITGYGDVSYNARRSILGAIPVAGRIAYHLFTTNTSQTGDIVKLNRKSKWSSQLDAQGSNYISGFDFNPNGESVATFNQYGECVILDVNANNYIFHLKVGSERGRCRWSTSAGEPLLFVKYDWRYLNIVNVEKQALTLKKSFRVQREKRGPYWIDVCPNDRNLLAGGGSDQMIKVFDKREGKTVKSFEYIHKDSIECVRWSPSGDMLASASRVETIKLLDFRAWEIIHTRTTGYTTSVCFI